MKNIFIVFCFLLSVTACSTSSTGRNQIALYSDKELNHMGSESFEKMKHELPINSDKNINAFVLCVADAITVNIPELAHQGEWEVVVFDSEQLNAFALPGGKIGVYTGILQVIENQDQLAAIIGHEIGHVLEKHSNERLSANKLSNVGMMVAAVALGASDIDNKGLWFAGLGIGVQYGMIMPYSRSHESEADIIGQNLMAQSGFNPTGSVELWQNMSKVSDGAPPEFLSTHPANDTRIKQLIENLSVSKAYFEREKAAGRIPSCEKPSKTSG